MIYSFFVVVIVCYQKINQTLCYSTFGAEKILLNFLAFFRFAVKMYWAHAFDYQLQPTTHLQCVYGRDPKYLFIPLFSVVIVCRFTVAVIWKALTKQKRQPQIQKWFFFLLVPSWQRLCFIHRLFFKCKLFGLASDTRRSTQSESEMYCFIVQNKRHNSERKTETKCVRKVRNVAVK